MENKNTNSKSEIYAKEHLIQPWPYANSIGNEFREFVTNGDGIYLIDKNGNKLIDGPAGMWCTNIGHRNTEIAKVMYEQAVKLSYNSPWYTSNEPSAMLSKIISEYAPGDLNNVFFTTGGSTAVESAIRFVHYYNNVKGRPEKKLIISREDGYHGSTYLSASLNGKSRTSDWMNYANEMIVKVSSPKPFRNLDNLTLNQFEDKLINEIENKIVALVGEDKANEFWQNYRDNYVARADIDQLAEWGFNHIRLPFHYKQFYNSDGSSTPIGYAIVDTLLSWCAPYNMYVVLDMHCAPGAQNGGPISDSDGTARLWLEEENKQLTIQIWREIADYYSDHQLIGGYDLINEPVLPQGVTLEEFKQLYVDITTAVREVDQNHIVYIEGNWYGTDFSGLTPPWDSNMSYSFHKYWGETDYSTIMSYITMSNAHSIPLWMGESGENSSSWYWEVFTLLEENNIGWNFWTHKKVEKITSPFSVVVQPEYQMLIDTSQSIPK